MRTSMKKRVLAVLLSLLMVVGLVPSGLTVKNVKAADGNVYVLDATADLTAAAENSLADGGTIVAGTEGFFTIYTSAKMKIDGSEKTFDDGYVATQRINPGGKSDVSVPKNVIGFTTEGVASVKIWWVSGGDGRTMAILDSAGEVVTATAATDSVKNSLYISTLEIAEAGSYYVALPEGSNYIFKVQVTDTVSGGAVEAPRKDWSEVADPVLGTPTLKDENTITIPYTMLIGDDGADSVEILVKDEGGNVITTLKSLIEAEGGSKDYVPDGSGIYTFSIVASRDGEKDKTGAKDVQFDFILPLVKPSISAAYNKGNGSVAVEWAAVKEATSYVVEYSTDGTTWTKGATSTTTSATVSGLTVGTTYKFRVSAVRGIESVASEVTEVKAKADSEVKWAFAAFGSGVNTSDNKFSGNLNEDGTVRVWSLNKKGKIVPTDTDGLAFYYTPIESNMNFTLRAKFKVNSWTYTNGQEGFGIMAADRVGTHGDSTTFWNNSYMATVTKVEYYGQNGAVSSSGDKISMKLGIGSQQKIGVTKDNLNEFNTNTTAAMNQYFSSKMEPLDTTCINMGTGTYNLIGNYTNTEATFTTTCLDKMITEVELEIQKNNTGYFVSYIDAKGNKTTQKYYDTEALSNIDEDYVYVGFYASRMADVTVSDVTLTVIDPKDDAPAEERPVDLVDPSYSLTSATVANKSSYVLRYLGNADGKLVVKDASGKVVAEQDVLANTIYRFDTTLALGENKFTATMTPNADYRPSEYEKLSSYEAQELSIKVTYNNFDGDVIYVSPTGKSTGKGTKANPTDIYTATKYASAGQTIVILEGTYHLASTVTVQLGVSGTADKMIYLIADPEAKTRPVFDFDRNCEGMVIAGDYWYLSGFDVTDSANSKDGIRVSGSYNVVDNVNTYYNGNTGIQISRFNNTVDKSEWPAYNLVLNCTSYGNADAGYEDADGFAAKLTCGEGNVFDGCIAYNNADDGWDLYAKPETGEIGVVTIQNCVAFANGYNADGSPAGNGNGFKLGGTSIPGAHVLKNSVAFDNAAKGIDSNSGPDIVVENCISFNNGSYNCAFYTNTAPNTAYVASGIVSYRTKYLTQGENFKTFGTQDATKLYQASNYFWAYTGEGSKNSQGTVTDSWFVSVDTKGTAGKTFDSGFESLVYSSCPITRNADNSINMNGILVLTDEAKAILGEGNYCVVGGQASKTFTLTDLTVTTGLSVDTGDHAPIALFLILAILAGAAVAGVTVFEKKRKFNN